MKRVVTILLAVMVVAVLAVPALAKKVPKQICFSYDDGGTYYITVGTKKQGWVRYQDAGKVDFYVAQGLENRTGGWNLLSGSAAIGEFGEMYIQAYSGMTYYFEIIWFWGMPGEMNQVSIVDLITGTPSGPFDLTEVNCRNVQLGGP